MNDPRLPSAHTIFHHACVVDGLGSPRTQADLLVQGERIVALCPPGAADEHPAQHHVNARGLVLCPGFIDILSQCIGPLLRDGRNVSKISQGITTEIMGEAWTPAPANHRVDHLLGEAWHWPRFSQWLIAMVHQGVSPNVGSMISGHNVRACVMGMKPGRPSIGELRQMQHIADEAMAEGALGISYALIYPPDVYTSTDEIIAVCQAVAARGGIYCTHLRSEGDRLLEALDEAFEISRSANIPLEIYHLKACGKHNWHKMASVIERINLAHDQGIDVEANMYPYTASGTGLTSILPPWTAAEGRLFENLDDFRTCSRIREQVLCPDGTWEAQLSVTGAEHVKLLGLTNPEHTRYMGWTLDQVARDKALLPVDAAIALLRAERQRIFSVFFKMSEENVRLQMQQPWVKFSTDAPAHDPIRSSGIVHPRGYGAMPRILGRYVRDLGLLSLEDAVARMTGQVARRLGLHDRGYLGPGAVADLVLFDSRSITDLATYDDPHQLSQGICGVWVNGTRVWGAQGHTGALPGKALLGPGAAPLSRTTESTSLGVHLSLIDSTET